VTRDLDKAAADFEKMIRQELGAAASLPWRVEVRQPGSKASTVAELFSALGTTLDIRAEITYDLPAPRPARLQLWVVQPGLNTLPAILLFSGELGHPTTGKAEFVPGAPGTGSFQGDAGLCARLNARRDLLAAAAGAYRGKLAMARLLIDIPPAVEVAGDGAAAQLHVRNVPVLKGLLGKLQFQVKELLALRAMVEGVVQ